MVRTAGAGFQGYQNYSCGGKRGGEGEVMMAYGVAFGVLSAPNISSPLLPLLAWQLDWVWFVYKEGMGRLDSLLHACLLTYRAEG